jgi:4'-phosphopantetheinyl transferase
MRCFFRDGGVDISGLRSAFYLYPEILTITFWCMKQANRDHLERHVVVRMARLSQADVATEAYLNPQDKERAGRFRFPEDRARFVLGRGLLGSCLSRYLDYPAAPLDLAWTSHGRPFLPHDPEVQFSISHTHELVAVAVSIGTLVGIDLEYMRVDFNVMELAERIFSEEDMKAFRALPTDEALSAFFRAWTSKEAYLKAQGVGLSGGLKEISISFGPGPQGRIMDAFRENNAQKWRVEGLPLPAGYAGHLAWNDPEKQPDFDG